ncbi:MAG: hypothetical protein NTY10_03930 [Candidatus Omnitrophica bacterium]|nr:hypothetical protein [Candidatus Omnitrophota bacterium]
MNKKWLVIATIFLGLLISIPSFAGEGKGPVCSLNFDQGEGLVIKDASGNNNNGQILNENIRKYSPGGRHILSSSNTVTSGVKPENLRAMIETAKKYGSYPLT